MRIPSPAQTAFIVVMMMVGACALPFVVWNMRENQFHELYDAIQHGDSVDTVVGLIPRTGFSYKFETTHSLTIFTSIGIDSDMVMDVDFNDAYKVKEKSAFDTGFHIGPF